jgi:Ca-activated chloride channel family protein
MKTSQRRFRNLWVAIILLALFALTAAQEPSPQKQNGFTVKLSLIVTDRSRHALDDLSKDSIQIIEDKVPQTASLFSKDDRPVDYGLVIDNTGSFRKLIGASLQAAKLIISNNRDVDETFIERFTSADKIETVQEFTADKSMLLKSLDTLYIEGGQSAVHDAIYLAVKHVAEHRPGPDRRQALVLLTDGEDRASYYTESQLLQLLRGKNVQVFVIGIVAQLETAWGKLY